MSLITTTEIIRKPVKVRALCHMKGCMSRQKICKLAFLVGLGICAATNSARAQFGIALSGAGPINRSVAGASSVPLDANGALYWNPATISGLTQSEMEFGLEILYPRTQVSSFLPANSFGPGFPPANLSGTTSANNGVIPIPTIGVVYRPSDSRLTYGLGIFAAGGFSSNYPASTTNPILTPQPPLGFGLGAVAAQLQVYQIMPTISYQVTDRLSVGFSPTVDLAYLTADPGFLAAPDDANHDGFKTFEPANHSRVHWGAGFQVGAYYRTDKDWHFGASFKSPQWFETFRFNSHDELGRPQTLLTRFDYPMIVTIGTGYTGFERWALLTDLHYLDYHNTKGFSREGFDSTGAVAGLGWNSMFALGSGVQYQATDALSLRMGYSFNTNPIPSRNAVFNVASPLMLQHVIYAGASYRLTDSFLVSIAYAHAFENSVTGPIVSPLGIIPGSSVQSKGFADTWLFGATVKF
jgi:long-chain fatty acid transport protein